MTPPRRWEDRLARGGGRVEALRAPAILYGAVVRARNALYDAGLLPVARLDLPIVCVGNLTAGGTGKSPMVVLLARALRARGSRPGVLARGYRRRRRGAPRSSAWSDESRWMERELPGVPLELDADRVAGATRLAARGADVVVMDDGFQHRRIARDLDLVLVDATRPWGLGASGPGRAATAALLPRGLLREPRGSLARAQAIVVTRCDQVGASELEALEEELDGLAPGAPVLLARHAPVRCAPLGDGEDELELGALRGLEVDLASAIGNPEAFERTVASLGARVRTHRRFPDHHEYASGDLDGLGGERPLLTTAKDAVKLRAPGSPVHVLEIELALERGAGVLDALLDALPEARARRERRALHEGLHG